MKSLLEVFYRPGTLFESLPERPAAWPAAMAAVLALALFATRLDLQGRAPLPGMYFSAGFVALLTPLVIAGGMFAFSMMRSRKVEFPWMLSMVALSYFAYSLASVLVRLAQLPGTDAAAFMDRASMPKHMYQLFSSLDALSFAFMALLAYGFGKLSRGGVGLGFLSIGLMWVMYVSLKTVIAFVS
jgi:hypothetical protein